MLTDILYSLNMDRLISVNISRGTFFSHEKSSSILTDINWYLQYYENMGLYRLISVKHLYEWKND